VGKYLGTQWNRKDNVKMCTREICYEDSDLIKVSQDSDLIKVSQDSDLIKVSQDSDLIKVSQDLDFNGP
jgi:hypothetical protein